MLIVMLLALMIGLSLGLLGGGGSILAVPILTYAAGLPPKEAIATSLLVVGATSAFSLLQHARRGNVAWRTGFLFAITSMVGAYAGGRAAYWFSGRTLLFMFAGMMAVTAIGMFRGRKETAPKERSQNIQMLVILEGFVVGLITGLVGAGGGFLVVPALVLFANMPMRQAIGTSLLVIALNSSAAFAGHITHVHVNYWLATQVTGAAMLGSLVGARASQHVPAQILRKYFAIFVLIMAVYVTWRSI